MADEPQQTWSAEGYAQNARFVSDLGQAVLDLLAPVAGERILDLGCGDGALTVRLVERGAQVVGVDSSPSLVEAARSRGLDVRLMDGQRLSFDAQFDAVFSNAALHWMRDAEAVIAGVGRALKPGGRFVGELGGHGNVAAICTALFAALRMRGIDGRERFPWYYPTEDDYAQRLGRHGFEVRTLALLPRPTPLPTGMRGWLETFANPFLAGFTGPDRATLLDDVTELLRPSLCDETGRWTADYVRLRFDARLGYRGTVKGSP